MPTKIDAVGRRFGRLIVIGDAAPDGNRRTRYAVRCDCGTEKVVDGAHLRYGRIVSCGCYLHEVTVEKAAAWAGNMRGKARTHGLSRRPVYAVWKTMLDRCRNPRNKDFRHYGGQGVRVCERWQSFENFYADMGEPNGLTLDRVDCSGDYEPGNCRWATWSQQNRNKRAHAHRHPSP